MIQIYTYVCRRSENARMLFSHVPYAHAYTVLLLYAYNVRIVFVKLPCSKRKYEVIRDTHILYTDEPTRRYATRADAETSTSSFTALALVN